MGPRTPLPYEPRMCAMALAYLSPAVLLLAFLSWIGWIPEVSRGTHVLFLGIFTSAIVVHITYSLHFALAGLARKLSVLVQTAVGVPFVWVVYHAAWVGFLPHETKVSDVHSYPRDAETGSYSVTVHQEARKDIFGPVGLLLSLQGPVPEAAAPGYIYFRQKFTSRNHAISYYFVWLPLAVALVYCVPLFFTAGYVQIVFEEFTNVVLVMRLLLWIVFLTSLACASIAYFAPQQLPDYTFHVFYVFIMFCWMLYAVLYPCASSKP